MSEPETNNGTVDVVKQDWMDDLQICLTFLTRIPIPGGLIISKPSLGQSTRFFPVIGALIGLIGVIVLTIADILGLPFGGSVLIALLSIALVTGGLNEDGLAHTADTIARRAANIDHRLDILKNDHIGTFGILALIFAVTLKWAALTSFSYGEAAVSLFLMSVISTGGLPIFMRYLPNAEQNDLSDWDKQPEFDKATTSVVLALMASFFTVGFWVTTAIIIVLVGVTGLVSWFLTRLFGGTTGQLLGTLQQISEISIVLTIAVLNSE